MKLKIKKKQLKRTALKIYKLRKKLQKLDKQIEELERKESKPLYEKTNSSKI